MPVDKWSVAEVKGDWVRLVAVRYGQTAFPKKNQVLALTSLPPERS